LNFLSDFISSYHFTALQWGLAIFAAFGLGMSKTGFLGIALLDVAIMAEVWPARESTGVILPMLVFADFFALLFFSRHALWNEVWRVLPPAIGGVFLGFLCFGLVPSSSFAPLIGWIVLVLLLLQLVQRQLGNERFARILTFTEIGEDGALKESPTLAHRLVAVTLGALSGVTMILANAAGPVMTVYLLAIGLAKYEFVGTSAWIFCIINLSKLPFSYALGVINWHTLGFNLLMFPAVALGAVFGKRLLKLIPWCPPLSPPSA
jgi:uncharacterized protein